MPSRKSHSSLLERKDWAPAWREAARSSWIAIPAPNRNERMVRALNSKTPAARSSTRRSTPFKPARCVRMCSSSGTRKPERMLTINTPKSARPRMISNDCTRSLDPVGAHSDSGFTIRSFQCAIDFPWQLRRFPCSWTEGSAADFQPSGDLGFGDASQCSTMISLITGIGCGRTFIGRRTVHSGNRHPIQPVVHA